MHVLLNRIDSITVGTRPTSPQIPAFDWAAVSKMHERDSRLRIRGKRKAQAKRRGDQLKAADTRTGMYKGPLLPAR